MLPAKDMSNDKNIHEFIASQQISSMFISKAYNAL